jgi:hypothetical protein
VAERFPQTHEAWADTGAASDGTGEGAWRGWRADPELKRHRAPMTKKIDHPLRSARIFAVRLHMDARAGGSAAAAVVVASRCCSGRAKRAGICERGRRGYMAAQSTQYAPVGASLAERLEVAKMPPVVDECCRRGHALCDGGCGLTVDGNRDFLRCLLTDEVGTRAGRKERPVSAPWPRSTNTTQQFVTTTTVQRLPPFCLLVETTSGSASSQVKSRDR